MSKNFNHFLSFEEYFKKIFNIIPNPIYIFKKVEDKLILIDYNEAAKLFSENKIDEFLGHEILELYPQYRELIEKLKLGSDLKGYTSIESKFKTKSTGVEKRVKIMWYKIPPDLIMVNILDITDQKELENALRKSENEKTIIFENIPELIVFQDYEHNIIGCNKAACNSVDLSLEQLIGRKCYEIWQNRNDICENCPVDSSLKTGQQNKGEITTPDGRIWDIRSYPVRDDKGNSIGAVELLTEISERKRAERELRESEEKFRTIFESIPDLFFLLSKDTIILDYRGKEEDFYVPPKEFIGKKVYDVLPFELGKLSLEFVKKTIKTRKAQTLEYVLPVMNENRHYEARFLYFSEDNVAVFIRDITERKKAEEQVRYQANLVENVSDAIISTDIDFNIISWNKAAESIYGWKAEEVIGKNVRDTITVEYLADTDENVLKSFAEKGYWKGEVMQPRKDGKEIYVHASVALIKDIKGKPIGAVAINRDITGYKKFEKKIIKEREKAELYLNLVNVILVALDKYGTITLINKKGIELLGYEKDELIGINWFDNFIKEENRDEIRAIFNQLMAGEIDSAENYENPIITKEGNERMIAWHNTIIKDNQGEIIGTLSSGEDITTRKIAEQKLKESEEKYRTLSEQSLLGIAIAQDNKLKYMNETYSKIFGYTFQEIEQWTIEDLKVVIHPDDFDFILDQFLKKQRGEADISKNYQYRAFKKNGDMVWVDNYSKPIIYEGKAADFITVIDITDRKKAEDALKKSEEKYREAYNRSDLYKDIFTHDINNILQNILSSVELSKLFSTDPTKTEKIKEVSNLISEQIIRGKKLVSNVQKLSEVEEIKTPLSSIEASKVLTNAIEFVKGSFPYKSLNIQTESFQEQHFVIANDLLVNMLENILFNAIKHNINEKIEILIRISRKIRNGINFIKFEFLDNGVGIPDSMKKEIFSRYYRGYKKDRVPSGIGLGLLLVKRIVDSYNGKIEVEDKIKGDYSKGSNFIILIPEANLNSDDIYC